MSLFMRLASASPILSCPIQGQDRPALGRGFRVILAVVQRPVRPAEPQWALGPCERNRAAVAGIIQRVDSWRIGENLPIQSAGRGSARPARTARWIGGGNSRG